MNEKKKSNVFGLATKAAHTSRRRIIKINMIRRRKGLPTLSREEERKIEAIEYRKAKRDLKKTAILLAIGITAGAVGAKGVQLLNSANNKSEITTDIEKGNSSTNLKEGREIFLNSLQVDVEDAERNKTLEDNIREEVNSLKNNPDEFLDYVKQIYAEDYNSTNNENISKTQINFYRTRVQGQLYKDKALNGEEIIREQYGIDESKDYIDISEGVIEAGIVKGEDRKEQKIVKHYGEYLTVYQKDEKVEQYEDNNLAKLGEVIDKGITCYGSMKEVQTTEQKIAVQKYRESFIEAVVKYKEGKIKDAKQSDYMEYK